MDMDDEILEDFLIEAGEIIEQLGGQLVQLEQRPNDAELLNAVFRAFHTVKGGAGFLSLNDLVELCHQAENVFNLLRSGERVIDAQLMDIILRAFDGVTQMFEEIKNGMPTTPADEELLAWLDKYSKPGEVEVATDSSDEVAAESVSEKTQAVNEPIVEQALETRGNEPANPEGTANRIDSESSDTDAAIELEAIVDSDSELITEDEFESLLDLLHGKSGGSGGAGESAETDAATDNSVSVAASEGSSDDLITEDEFEALLDSLSEAKAEPETKSETSAKLEDSKLAENSQPEPALETAASVESTKVAAPQPATAKPAKPLPKAAESADTSSRTAEIKAPQAETNIRVETKVLDDIMNMVGELVLVRNRLLNLVQSTSDEHVNQAVVNLNLVTSQLQVSAMKTRMQPIKKVFGRFPRVVRDVSRSLGKEIKLTMHGEETDLDKNLVEALADPLVHLVRNSVDHGIEMPDDRAAAGKPRQGEIVLSADQEGDSIVLKIKDDGKGMDPEKLRQTVVDKGLMDREAVDRLTDSEAFALIFMPGFSTKVEVTDISGRGVGMDVVKTRISELSGSVEIDSELDVGTEITIRVPLTLAIVAALVVGVNNQLYALPLSIVNEIFDLRVNATRNVDGQIVVVTRDEVLPIFQLDQWLAPQVTKELKDDSHVVVVSIGVRRVGFVVDQLYGQEEVVIKPLGTALERVKGFAGATINGDGRMALILDAPGLIEHYA